MTLPQIPERIGKYPIVRELGHGATSRVYLGRDPFADRDVAIKVMHKDPDTDPLTRNRFDRVFLNEASLVGKLIHPNIIAIYDADVNIEFSYIAMEYVDGRTLEPYCQVADLLPLERVVEISFKCGLALDFANRSGIIHRDIKPTNILVGQNGEIKITDFGVALQHDVEMTQLEGVGSPLYMSPEQAQDHALTHQADIYSLGVVMYRMLTGKTPFSASNSTSLLYQVMNMTPPAPSVHRAGLPADLDRIVLKALAKNLDERYQTWEEFCADLARTNRNLALQADSISDNGEIRRHQSRPLLSRIRASRCLGDGAHRGVPPARSTRNSSSGRRCLRKIFSDCRGWRTRHERGPVALSTRRRRLLRRDPLLRRQGKAHQLHRLDYAVDDHRDQCDGAETIERRVPEAVQSRLRAHPSAANRSAIESQRATGRRDAQKIMTSPAVPDLNALYVGLCRSIGIPARDV